MKYLLIPFTVIAWYYVVYLSLYVYFTVTVLLLSLDWIYIIIITAILSSVIIGSIFSLFKWPLMLSRDILKLYNFSRFSIIIHSLAGLAGIIAIINIFFFQAQYVGETTTSMISGFWEHSVARTILLFVFTIPILCGFLYAFVIVPFQLKQFK